jgi:hypothetical protein
MPMRNRPRLVASSPSTTKLFVDDLREVAALSRSENKYRSDIIRDLVHEALRQRRLRAIGRDEGENYVRRIHQEAIEEGVGPVMKAITELRLTIESFSTNGASESQTAKNTKDAKTIETLFGLMAQLLHRVIVTENVVKILMTVGMQNDKVPTEEIRKQLAGHDETGLRESQVLIEEFLGKQRN